MTSASRSRFGGLVVELGASLGIALAASPTRHPTVGDADAAMDRAKAAGGTGYRCHGSGFYGIDWPGAPEWLSQGAGRTGGRARPARADLRLDIAGS